MAWCDALEALLQPESDTAACFAAASAPPSSVPPANHMKKKNAGDLMQDSLSSKLMFAIKSAIYEEDLAAKKVDLQVKDSDAKSAIRKALGMLKGKPPKKPGSTPREQWVMQTEKENIF